MLLLLTQVGELWASWPVFVGIYDQEYACVPVRMRQVDRISQSKIYSQTWWQDLIVMPVTLLAAWLSSRTMLAVRGWSELLVVFLEKERSWTARIPTIILAVQLDQRFPMCNYSYQSTMSVGCFLFITIMLYFFKSASPSRTFCTTAFTFCSSKRIFANTAFSWLDQ